MDWLGQLKSVFGDGWLFFAAVAIYLIANSGLIPKLLGERRGAQAKLIDNYETEASNQRRWRAEDAERYELRIARLEGLVDKMSEAALLSERGNARLRHLVGNLFAHIAAQRDQERRRGLTPIPYDGWRDALNISADLDERLRALFEDAASPPGIPPPPGATC